MLFTALTLLSAAVIPVEDCACFGEALKLTPWQTFVKNLALLPMALVVWWRYRPHKIFAFNPLEIVLTVTFFFLSMYLWILLLPPPAAADRLPALRSGSISGRMRPGRPSPAETEPCCLPRNIKTGKAARVFARRHGLAGCRKMGVGPVPDYGRDARHPPARPGEFSCAMPKRCDRGDRDRSRRVYTLRYVVRPPAAQFAPSSSPKVVLAEPRRREPASSA